MKRDTLAMGFITTVSDAVLLRIESASSNDYLEIEIVSNEKKKPLDDKTKSNHFNNTLRSRVTFSPSTTWARTTIRSARSESRSTIISTTSSDSRGAVPTARYRWTTTTCSRIIHKVSVLTRPGTPNDWLARWFRTGFYVLERERATWELISPERGGLNVFPRCTKRTRTILLLFQLNNLVADFCCKRAFFMVRAQKNFCLNNYTSFSSIERATVIA